MHNRDAILTQLKDILAEDFEIDPQQVKPETNLYVDLDLDSIDAVDLVVKLQQLTGKKIRAEEFKSVRTVEQLVTTIDQLVNQPTSA